VAIAVSVLSEAKLIEVIDALVTASGPLGLSAFFPPKDRRYDNAPLTPGRKYPKYLPPPHLPLTATWLEADFALENVMSTTALPSEAVNLRQYCMRLLSRYMYLSGEYGTLGRR
jgi:3-O-alpha-D-mannopyranosyl-alpha-D-mannopyranose xylosylphosphotransferase